VSYRCCYARWRRRYVEYTRNLFIIVDVVPLAMIGEDPVKKYGRKMKMRKIAISALIVMMLIAPMVMPVYAGTGDTQLWYRNVEGVLSSDSFYCYPYKPIDLKIGLSKFGEKINPYVPKGLQYNGPPTAVVSTSGADPFANPGVLKEQWIEGWWIAFTYQNRIPALGWRTLWAWALFSDFTNWGSPAAGNFPLIPAQVTAGGWTRYQRTQGPATAAGLEPHGGRKTNARVETAEPVVLYDGPRKFIALISHTLYDQSIDVSGGLIVETGPNIPVIRFDILVEFNKVKKEVIQKKDVKLLLDEKTMVGDKAYLELSNRAQWDLGTTEHYLSYAHFWTATSEGALDTHYGDEYHKPEEKEWLSPCTGYGIQWPNLGDQWGKYAKAQIISSVTPYVGWTTFWPHPSYWTVDGFEYPFCKWGQDLSGQWPAAWDEDDAPQTLRVNDMATEPEIPLVGAEWDFIFSVSREIIQFRGITTYGVTDQNDCDDVHAKGKGTAYPVGSHATNVLDKEVMFQNDEVYNPYDLYSAVHKDTARWVDHNPANDETTKGWASEPVIVVSNDAWWKYCEPAEKVVNLVTNKVMKRGSDYNFVTSGVGKGKVTWLITEPSDWKILYSTNPPGSMGAYEWITVGTISAPIDSAGAAMVSEAFDSWKDINVTKAGLDVWESVHDPNKKVPWLFKVKAGGNEGTRTDYRDSLGRTHLFNDFCKSNPIKTSNIIYVGGPLVNFGTEYMNDFTPVLYGLSGYAHASWEGKIVAAECWSRNTYSGMGYAVIAVYKDIDGTVHLGIWGATGVDTYYACMWMWFGLGFLVDYDGDGVADIGEHYYAPGQMPGIKYLQGENEGVVAIILKFDYAQHYTDRMFACIWERIGTISEKWPHQDP